MTRTVRRRLTAWWSELVIASGPRDRGDVPGWVLITVMTAGLVTALWIVADDQLRTLFTNALGRVTGP